LQIAADSYSTTATQVGENLYDVAIQVGDGSIILKDLKVYVPTSDLALNIIGAQNISGYTYSGGNQTINLLERDKPKKFKNLSGKNTQGVVDGETVMFNKK